MRLAATPGTWRVMSITEEHLEVLNLDRDVTDRRRTVGEGAGQFFPFEESGKSGTYSTKKVSLELIYMVLKY